MRVCLSTSYHHDLSNALWRPYAANAQSSLGQSQITPRTLHPSREPETAISATPLSYPEPLQPGQRPDLKQSRHPCPPQAVCLPLLLGQSVQSTTLGFPFWSRHLKVPPGRSSQFTTSKANPKFGCTAPSVAVKARCTGTYPTSG